MHAVARSLQVRVFRKSSHRNPPIKLFKDSQGLDAQLKTSNVYTKISLQALCPTHWCMKGHPATYKWARLRQAVPHHPPRAL